MYLTELLSTWDDDGTFMVPLARPGPDLRDDHRPLRLMVSVYIHPLEWMDSSGLLGVATWLRASKRDDSM